MNKSRFKTVLYIFLGLALLTSSANATVVQYLDRASWSSAVGAVSGTEDFNGFTSDTQFRTQTVALNGMTVSAGVSQHHGASANIIDVATFEFSDGFAIDSTPYLLADIELAESGGELVPINLRFNFNNPLSAWGADLTSFPTASTVLVEVFGPNLADPPLASFQYFPSGPGSEIDFFGFHVTDGLLADHIVFSIGDASGYETFGMDNIAFVSAVPTPAAAWLFGSGLLGLVGMARRKKA